MSLNKLIGTFGSLVVAGAIAFSSYTPRARAEESTNSYIPVISTAYFTNNLAGNKVFRLSVTNTMPNSTNNIVETRDRMTTDENIGGNWALFKKNIAADTNGNYSVDLPANKYESYARVGRTQ